MNYFQKKYLVFAILLFSINTSAQTKINSINFEGNEFYSSRDILNFMVLKKGDEFNKIQFQSDLQAIRDQYKKSGFLKIKFENQTLSFNEDSSLVDISFVLNEGELIKLGIIEIQGNKLITEEEIFSIFQTKPNNVLNNNILNNDIKDLLELYEKKGFPFVTVNVNQISLYKEAGKDKLKVSINIQENPKIKIEEIKIKGNEITNEDVILREIKLNKDDKINSSYLNEIKRKLEKLDIFERVEEPKIYTTKNKSGLLIEVKEGNTNTFDGIVGYIPETNNEKGYFTGLVNVTFKNLFGSGRKVYVKWQKENKTTQDLEFKYFEPYIFGFPFHINTGFEQRIQDTSYIKRNLNLKGELLVSNQFSFIGILEYNRLIPSTENNTNYIIANSQTLLSGGELYYDTRDNIYNPSKGILYKTNYLYGQKEIYNFEELQEYGYKKNYSYQKYSAELELYLSFLKRQTTFLKLFGGEVKSDKLEEPDFFRVGGIKNIRGYRDNQFLASKFAYGNLEFRYSLTRKSFAFTFYDFGYYYKPFDEINLTEEQKGFLYGLGLGLRIDTSIGIIGVSYAVGKGDSLGDGKIHFGLINNF